MAVLVQRRFRSLEQPREPRAAERGAREGVVRGEENGRPEEAADEGRLVADDRVLDDVRQQEEDDEVERRELRELPFARDAEQDDQSDVDRERTDDLVPPGQAEMDEVVGHAFTFGGDG